MRQSLQILSKHSDGISDLNILDKLEEKQSGVAHKPANFYKFNKNTYEKYLKSGFLKFEF